MNYKLIELLIPVLIRVLELLLQREERKDDEQTEADHMLAQRAREHYGKSDAEIIEEVFS